MGFDVFTSFIISVSETDLKTVSKFIQTGSREMIELLLHGDSIGIRSLSLLIFSAKFCKKSFAELHLCVTELDCPLTCSANLMSHHITS